MRSRIMAYVMTVVAVGCFFRAGPDLESTHFPIVTEQVVTNVKRLSPPIDSVLSDQQIENIKRTNDAVCYDWSFTKKRDIPLAYIGFNAIDERGYVYDAETIDQETKDPIFITSTTRYKVGIRYTRHLCTTLPYINDPLTVRGTLVYKTALNLWPVTHFTPTIIVPKESSEVK